MQERKESGYTYADYWTWTDEARYELMDGVAYAMSPAPAPRHQEIGGEIFRQIANYLKGKRCKVYNAPFDVRLDPDGADDTVVQPDITVVCDPGKIDGRGCRGVPDMVIEVLSPSTGRWDRVTKFSKYRAVGVREYWMVDPETRTVQACVLGAEGYVVRGYDETEEAPVSVLEGLCVDLREVFPAAEAGS